MKTILMSIKPKWCELIASGKKTIEVRKTAPRETPFRVVMYCTKNLSNRRHFRWGNEIFYATNNKEVWSGKVIGEFICDKVDTIVYTGASYEIKGETTAYTNQVARGSCLEFPDLRAYLGVKGGKALHIIDSKLYDKPRELSEFRKPCVIPEMSYCPACKFGSVQYGSDVECYDDTYGGSCEWLCLNALKRPPQSWMYVEEEV